MATFPPLLIITAAFLLCGMPTVAQDAISNFQVANRNSTHITFSWDIVDNYYDSSYISYFEIYYKFASGSSYNSYLSISTSNVNLIQSGRSFKYTTTTIATGYNGEHVMWVYVYRPILTPSGSYSDQLPVDLGQHISIEMNIKLWPSQTCHEFSELSTNTYVAVQNEVYWALRKYCQCTYQITQDIRLNNGYFTCSESGYVTFRAHLYSTDITTDPASFKSTLTNWLQGQDTDKTITIYGRRYSVKPGPCGVTIPQLHAPTCSTPAATQAAGASSSTTAAPTQDNTAVIVASVFAVMFFILSLGLIGYILAARRRQTTRSTGARMAKKTTRPSTAPAQAATRRVQPKTHAKQECELEPRYYPNQDEIYTEMDDF